AGQQKLGQHYPLTPSSREIFEGLGKLFGTKTQPFQYFFGFGLYGIAVKQVKFMLQFSQLFYQLVAVIDFHFPEYSVYLFLKLKFSLKAFHGYGKYGIFGLVRKQVLVEKTDGTIAGFGNVSRIGLIFSYN